MRRLFALLLLFAPLLYAVAGCNDFVVLADSRNTFVPFSLTDEGRYDAVRFVSVFDNPFGTNHSEFLVVAKNNAGVTVPNGTIFLPLTNVFYASLFDYATMQQNNTVTYYCDGVQTDTWTVDFFQSLPLETTNGTVTGTFLKVSSWKKNAFAFDYNRSVSSYFYALAVPLNGMKVGTVFFETVPRVYQKATLTGVTYVACCTNQCDDRGRTCTSNLINADDSCLNATTLHDMSCVSDTCIPKDVECAFGCFENGCKPGKPYCNDSDKGASLYEKGFTEGVDDTYKRFNVADECVSDYKLREYVCMGNNLSSNDLDCFYGCSNGACRRPPAPTEITPGSFENPTPVPEKPRTAEDNTALQIAGAIALLAIVLALGYADFAKKKK
ncbi:Uncharacterised protein [Candidatus Norongarragalina meridionalis]|nr:Uncharacterised protein [Candidatus Norongarragalina meridionalis]